MPLWSQWTRASADVEPVGGNGDTVCFVEDLQAIDGCGPRESTLFVSPRCHAMMNLDTFPAVSIAAARSNLLARPVGFHNFFDVIPKPRAGRQRTRLAIRPGSANVLTAFKEPPFSWLSFGKNRLSS